MTGVSIPLLLFLVSNLHAVAAGDWPQWRGPSRDGIASGFELPTTLPKELKTIWKVEVGLGHSSPVVSSGRVFILARVNDDEICLGLDAATGKEIWRHAYPARFRMDSAALGHGMGPKATMTIDDDRVYAFGISEALTCLDAASGKVLWEKRYDKDYPDPWPQFGAASSPLIEGNLCIVQLGAQGKGAIVAYDKKTGSETWRNEGEGPAYASPMAFTLVGARQIVTFARNSLLGVDAKEGNTLWSIKFVTPYEQNIITPVAEDDLLVYSGIDQGVFAARIERVAGRTTTGGNPKRAATVWTNKDHNFYMSSPVIHEGHLYGFSYKKKGTFVCLDLKDGKTLWESPGRGGDNASFVVAGNRLLALMTDGTLKVIAADPSGYHELVSWTVASSPTWAHLAVADKCLYIKDAKSLACFEF